MFINQMEKLTIIFNELRIKCRVSFNRLTNFKIFFYNKMKQFTNFLLMLKKFPTFINDRQAKFAFFFIRKTIFTIIYEWLNNFAIVSSYCRTNDARFSETLWGILLHFSATVWSIWKYIYATVLWISDFKKLCLK